jgi:CheY-like chemotaxis protein
MQKLPCILLVDDDQTTNYLNQLLLSRLGVADKVLVAINGREALTIVENHCQDAQAHDCPLLILLDVNMPVMNGFEFLEAYAALPEIQRKAAVVLMLTTSLHPQDVQRAQMLHIAGFLNKPLNKRKMQEVMLKHFQRELPD